MERPGNPVRSASPVALPGGPGYPRAVAFDADVLVVGAGPVGCAVAVALAARGIGVRVVDRDRRGRDKVCGEGLLPPGVDAARRLGLPLRGAPFRGIRYVGRRAVEGDFPDGALGLGVRRSESDAALAEHAARTVPVEHGRKVLGWSGGGGDLTVRTGHGPLRARLLVAADGARSSLRRLAGLDDRPRGRRRWAVRRHHAWLGAPLDRVEVHLLPAAEAYLTPLPDGRVNVALLLEDEVVGALRGETDRAFDALVAGAAFAHRLGPAAGAARSTGPLRQGARDVVGDGVLLVGDAAGFVDGVTGEGMSLGLCSAEPVAEVAARALATGQLAARGLAGWRRTHRDLAAASHRLTRLVVAGLRHRWLAEAVIAGLAARPRLFAHLLAVDVGRAHPAGLLRPSRWWTA